MYLSVVVIGCLVEFGEKIGCGRGGGRFECEIGGSEKFETEPCEWDFGQIGS